jgi:hypothetical protein
LASTDESSFGCGDTSFTLVDAVSTIDLGAETAVRLELNFNNSNLLYQSGKYNSHFGAMWNNYLFPEVRTCDQNTVICPDMFSFCSFRDDALTYNPAGEDCEYQLTHLSVNERAGQRLAVYPSPAEVVLNVELPSGTYSYEITSLTGQLVQSGKALSDGKLQLNTEALRSGVYFLQLKDMGGKCSRTNFSVR